MSHELYETEDGRASIGYVGQVPWHGLGQAIPENTPLEAWPKLAALDWSIETGPVFFEGKDQEMVKVPERMALYRSDNKGYLSVMSDRYKIVQPIEVLEFYRDLINTGSFQMNTAGSMFGGRKIWALASIGKDVTIRGDKLAGFLLLSTSCDGSLATTAQFTSVRVVCNNTLTVAVNGVDRRYAVKVPHHRVFDPEEVKMELGLANNAWNRHVDEIQALMDRKVRQREAVLILVQAMGNPEASIYEQPMARQMATIIELFTKDAIGGDMVTAKGTAWGLVNAVTQYADHYRNTQTVDSRMDSAWWGSWEKIKRSVFNECLERSDYVAEEESETVS